MKILVLSDIHASLSAAKLMSSDIEACSPDLVVICGDITHFGPLEFAEEFLSGIPVRCLAVHGNCDPFEVVSVLEEMNVNLHGKRVDLNGIAFVGFGGANITPLNTLSELTEDDIYAGLKGIMVRRAFLVTHVPPFGHVDSSFGRHLGSEAMERIVEEFRPRAVLSGHVHEARGIERKTGTLFLNPGPAGRGCRANVEVTGGDVRAELLGPD